MIQVQKLVKRFGLKTVLRKLDFQVAAGEFVGVVGPNGAGKTTLLRVLAALSRPTLGAVKIAGFSLPAQALRVRAKLGVLSHKSMLYGDLTAEQNLRFFGRMYGVVDLDARIAHMLDTVGLSARRRDLVRTFSRGMSQRLAIARAVLHDPQLLLLDEPYTGLDQDAASMLDAILRSVTSQGRTVVMTSHDLARISDLASRIDVLSRGAIVASQQRSEIPPDGLLAFYRHAIEGKAVTEPEAVHVG
ncbi:MAG: heme ABC exporter ATP-binding protein CcmA [Chloroflexi bacterium]|nr:heme ABC exporter ATP-binding protein CcmA [Chloroflexota bacterium]